MTSEIRGGFTSQHLSLIRSIAGQLSIAVVNILANEEIPEEKMKNRSY